MEFRRRSKGGLNGRISNRERLVDVTLGHFLFGVPRFVSARHERLDTVFPFVFEKDMMCLLVD
jgi:hypothetical protein